MLRLVDRVIPKRRSFQTATNWKTNAATMADLDSGTWICQNTRHQEAPSSLAASITSPGRVWAKLRMMKYANGIATAT